MRLKSILSDSFFGCKKFLHPQYQTLIENKDLTDQQIGQIFEPYTKIIDEVTSKDNLSLLVIFSEFIRSIAQRFIQLPLEKLSTCLQISAHVFEWSFQNHLSKAQSFEYFSKVVVRHSLFRPPHCVNVFSCEEAKEIRDFWIDNFVRFYEQYSQCFESNLNEILETHSISMNPSEEPTISKKQISRQDFRAKFGQILSISDAPKKIP